MCGVAHVIFMLTRDYYININDVAKAMIIVLNMGDVAIVLTCIVEMIKEGLITAMRTKDRFNVASQGGWRDNLINFTCKGSKHIVEVQVAHSQLVNARAGLPGHLIYGRVRNALELVVVAFGNKKVAIMRVMVPSVPRLGQRPPIHYLHTQR